MYQQYTRDKTVYLGDIIQDLVSHKVKPSDIVNPSGFILNSHVKINIFIAWGVAEGL